MSRILLVEDSEEFQKIVKRTLGQEEVTCAASVDEALSLIRGETFDLILLDIHLPKRSGYSLLSELQANEEASGIPVICLTGKSDVTDKVTAFSLGADDYVLKPFDPIELRARVEAKLKKAARKTGSFLSVGDLVIDQSTHRVVAVDGSRKAEIPVTQTEFKLLSCLARHPDQVYTRDQLLVSAWGEDADVLDRVVDVHLCSLRKKLGERSSYIQAVPGVGYKISVKKKAA